MKLTQKEIENILDTWVSLNLHIDDLNEEGIDQLMTAELGRSRPRPTFVYRLHYRKNKLRSQRERSQLQTQLVMRGAAR